MTAALPARARRQRELAALLSSRPLTTAEAAAELGISADDAGHVLRRLRTHGFEVVRMDPFEHEPRWRVLYPKGRVCAAEGCGTVLRRTNPSEYCERHRGGVPRLSTTPARRRGAPAPSGPEPAPQPSGARIRAERERHGVGLRTLAALASVSPADLSRIERGERGLSAEVADRLKTALTQAPALPTMDGAAIRAMREARGLTLREFAELVGLSPGFVSRLERGRRPVTGQIAARAAAVLGTSGPTPIDR